MELYGTVERVVVRGGWFPCEAVGVVPGYVLGKAEGVGARHFEKRVGGKVVVGVVDAREHDLGVVSKVGAVVDVSTVIWWRMCVEREEVVGGLALLARVVVVKVHAYLWFRSSKSKNHEGQRVHGAQQRTHTAMSHRLAPSPAKTTWVLCR